MSQIPTIGRIVLYRLDEMDAERVNQRRDDANRMLRNREGVTGTGEQVHVGSSVSAGEVYPMVIVRVFNDGLVSGQVLLDGNDSLWAPSITCGRGQHQYAWPVW